MTRLPLAVTLVCLSFPVRAEVYAYTDRNGTLHLTNIPDDPRYRPYPLEGRENTFRWHDNVGRLQRVHRIDVSAYDKIILEAAKYYGLPPALVKAVAAVESSFEPAAVSHAGAKGLMQIIPSTARAMQVRDPFDPRQSVFGGARYLRVLANEFAGDLRKTVAAYNAGPKRVTRAGGVPPIPETQQYVRRVLALYKHYLSTWKPGAQ